LGKRANLNLSHLPLSPTFLTLFRDIEAGKGKYRSYPCPLPPPLKRIELGKEGKAK